ncbi:M20/M25/M40 family metallo-hydrolase [Gracilibacillus oryzae]|uniref:M20/M25/M40 family metallo-hydrolase n=1 Tax=Gracilibacillus oryzae TaxID=1672701 RepID=A0A7C8KWS9_9BACI|nr:M20/M25/M40 family metallo-hydrolase [Gracilibacillus oryzae]KAB8138402.1 M20/M25/M40 family metallo-hydrolase [Gracilibacillus oryzae]
MKTDRIIQQFIELVKIDSETKYERKIADYLIKLFKDNGLEVTEDNTPLETNHEAGNILAYYPGNKQKEAIYFTSHMDTVVPGKGIQPSIQNNYICSDGTTILGADDKAGIAAIIETIHLLKENTIDHGDIYFLITSGEESGLVGSRYFDETSLPVKYGYALDSDGDVGHIITSAPSQVKLYATIYGKAAHAGVSPEKGVSAISLTAKAITKMPLGRIDEETTANIGSFEGKGPTNVVCEQVLLIAEARSLSEEKLDKQVKAMVEALQTTAEAMGGKVDIKTEVMYPSYRFDETDKVVKTAIQAAKKIGAEPILTTSGGGSDANHLAGKGVPTVNLAVGYENIHTTSERIPVNQLKQIPQLMIEIIKGVDTL